MRILNWLGKHRMVYPAMLVILLISVNTAIVYYNSAKLKETNAEKLECEKAVQLVSNLWGEVVRNADVAMRGYALGKAETLVSPLNDAIRVKPILLEELRTITAKQGFTQTTSIDSIDWVIENFLVKAKNMVQLVRNDQMDEFMTLLNADPGKDAWMVYARNSRIINEFEEQLRSEAIASYENASFRTVVFQSILFVFALPTLLFMIVKIVKDSKERGNLFRKLEMNNRDFLFNPGTSMDLLGEDEVIENSIRNFKTATGFIREVSGGNFAAKWDGITKSNESLNKENLAGELLGMRDRMKAMKQQDEIRNWVAEGLAKFSDILRKDQDNIQSLCYNSLVFITKYMHAQQGALFILKDDEEGTPFLDMAACYAFSRKKHINKRVDIGQGLVGQVYLEGKSVMMTEIPNGYTQITSGLGESTPNSILIVPFRSNDKIEAIIELAGFKKFEKHELEFMEKIGEIVASTLGSVKNTEIMQTLLDQFKTQTEQLKAQEEELRQNMEEMEATQEAIRRQDKEPVA